MPRSDVQHWTVTPAEAGQKLVQYLERRLPQLPTPAFLKWIRTGQVRVDGKRVKPFDRLAAGQDVRVPPYTTEKSAWTPSLLIPPDELLLIVKETEDLLVLNKPAGLAMHPGTGVSDSLTQRLAEAYPDAPFAPTPAHRLDKETSGLVLVAKSYERLAALHEMFRERRAGKIYLAWVAGDWPQEDGQSALLGDVLEKREENGFERVRSGAQGKQAEALALCLQRAPGGSLLAVKLITGRTHQVRAQLATRGFPILGDEKYQGPPAERLYLHAWRLDFSDECITLTPDWPAPYALAQAYDNPFPRAETPTP
jgi:23S rRNA pseudouridine955/2504/2580 synthase